MRVPIKVCLTFKFCILLTPNSVQSTKISVKHIHKKESRRHDTFKTLPVVVVMMMWVSKTNTSKTDV